MKRYVVYEQIRMGEVEVPDDVAKEQENDSDAIFCWMEENDCWPNDDDVMDHSVEAL